MSSWVSDCRIVSNSKTREVLLEVGVASPVHRLVGWNTSSVPRTPSGAYAYGLLLCSVRNAIMKGFIAVIGQKVESRLLIEFNFR